MAGKKRNVHDELQVVKDLALEQGASEDFANEIDWLASRASWGGMESFRFSMVEERVRGQEERDYYAEVQSAAATIVEEEEGDREAAIERAWEYADGAHAVIYYHEAVKTLQNSKNQDAWFDEGLGDLGDSFGEAITRMAFAAYHQDLLEAIEDALEAYEEAHAEEDEEDEDDEEDEE